MTIWELDDDTGPLEGLDADGRPDPAYAAALGMLPAPLPRRALAFAVDAVVYLLLQIPSWVFSLPLVLALYAGRISAYGFLNHPRFLLAVVMAAISTGLTLAFVIVQLVLHGRRGVTIGKALTGLRSVNVRTLERPGFFRVLLRALVVWASGLLVVGPLLFLLSPLLDRDRRRGWHDLVGQTWLVDVRRGLDPYDGKRMRIARRTVTAAPLAAAAALPSLATAAGTAEAYRPGARVSAGVLGVARPHGAGPRPVVGLAGTGAGSLATGSGDQPSTPGRPVVGGYRQHGRDGDGSDGSVDGPDGATGRAPDGDAPRAGDPRQTAAPGTAPSWRPAAPPPTAGPSWSGDAPRVDGLITGVPGGRPAVAPTPGPLTAETDVDDAGPLPARPAAPTSGAASPDASARPPVPSAGSASRPPAAAGSSSRPPAPPPAAPRAPAPAGAGARPPVPTAPPSAVGAPPVPPGRPAPTSSHPLGPAVSATGARVLVMESGERVVVDGPVVVGRNPVAPADRPDARAVAIGDDTRSMSKTHALLLPTADGIEVVDRRSTNGTAIVRGGVETRVEPGTSQVAREGDTIRLGDRTAAVQVREAAPTGAGGDEA